MIKYFICPDKEQVEVSACLASGGCRMHNRCATLPYLRTISSERTWRGITPSMAGSGPRIIYLRQTTDYAVSPDSRAFAALGTAVHGKLSFRQLNVLAEERLDDGKISGTADILEEDEEESGKYILTDYKTFASFKVAKCLGRKIIDIRDLDEDGKEIVYKTGKKKGQVKTKKVVVQDERYVEMSAEELQINMYRIMFEDAGFPVSRMRIMAIVRDGGTFVAESRGIGNNIYMIPVRRLPNDYVLNFYAELRREVEEAFATGYVRRCNEAENWGGARCERFCEVAAACAKMDETQNRKEE
ncbi:MAG TPA: hypothetical protein P5244_04230 [Syntrophales bacterium]|nr:hypothetical protein [Syntrophales bacterium]